MSLRTSTEPDLQRRAGAGRNETESDGTVRGGPGSEPDPRGPEPTGRRDMSESDGAESPHVADLGWRRELICPIRCGPGSEPDPRGSEPTGRRDMSESDGAESPHVTNLGRSRTRHRAITPDRASSGAGRGEYESDGTGAYMPRTLWTWIGAGPTWTGTDGPTRHVRVRTWQRIKILITKPEELYPDLLIW